jgi:hypothetical protein
MVETTNQMVVFDALLDELRQIPKPNQGIHCSNAIKWMVPPYC